MAAFGKRTWDERQADREDPFELREGEIKSLGDLETIQQASDYVLNLFEKQVDLAIEKKTLPNEPTEGDALARRAFWTLLPPIEQRAVFLRFIQNRDAWPRIRTLINSPPFSFLLAEDAQLLRAAGISRFRTNLAYSEAKSTSNSEFGLGHFGDAAERVYRVVEVDRPKTSDLLLWRGLRSGQRAVIDAKIKKRKYEQKLAILRGAQGANAVLTLRLPRPGETIRLRLTPQLRPIKLRTEAGEAKIQTDYSANDITIKVVSAFQRDNQSSVARLVVRIA